MARQGTGSPAPKIETLDGYEEVRSFGEQKGRRQRRQEDESLLQIGGAGKGLTLKLSLSSTPTDEIMVFASPPRPAGRSYCGDYRFIGLLPTPVEHVSDIKRLYLDKFGVPPANSRVFIRTWQEVDGWENRGQMRLTNALVPARGSGAGARPKDRAEGKKG